MTGKPLSIREVQPGDAAALAALVRDLGDFSSVTREAPEVTESRVAEHLGVVTSSDRHTLLVAVEGGELVGYCSAHWIPMMPRLSGYISELFVSASQRGGGVGTRLLESVEEEARKRGAGRLHLENFRTKASYERRFYAKRGWQERDAAASFVKELEGKTP